MMMVMVTACSAPDDGARGVFASGGNAENGKTLYTTCTACHGSDGRGVEALHAPGLSHQEEWYVRHQLGLFQSDARGSHPDDSTGAVMAAMVKAMSSSDLDDLAAFIATLPAHKPEPRITGNATRGKATWNDLCSACHGVKGQGNRELHAPRLAGSPDWYLKRQLLKYRTGLRGTHPIDVYGAQMLPMALVLADEAAIDDVVAYIASLHLIEAGQ